MKLKIITKKTKPDIFTISLVGTVDTETSSSLDAEIGRIIQLKIKTLVFDMEKVDFITSAGIGTIVKAKSSMSRIGGNIAMINLNPQVKKVFEIIRLLPALNVFTDMRELDEYLVKIQRGLTENQTL